MSHTETTEAVEPTELERNLAQAILAALEYRGFYDCGKYLDDDLIEHIRPFLTTIRKETLEEVMPFLLAYREALQSDWDINPVQSTNAVYRAPEAVLRDRADNIEAKRQRLAKLTAFLQALKK